MWTCEKCGRVFEKKDQPHSCRSVPLATHFKNRKQAKEIFDFLFLQIKKRIGKVKIISLPCCIHLFGKYDFLAALPKKDKLEIRFASDKKIDDPRVRQNFPTSEKMYKVCVDLTKIEDIDGKLMSWVERAFRLKK